MPPCSRRLADNAVGELVLIAGFTGPETIGRITDVIQRAIGLVEGRAEQPVVVDFVVLIADPGGTLGTSFRASI